MELPPPPPSWPHRATCIRNVHATRPPGTPPVSAPVCRVQLLHPRRPYLLAVWKALCLFIFHAAGCGLSVDMRLRNRPLSGPFCINIRRLINRLLACRAPSFIPHGRDRPLLGVPSPSWYSFCLHWILHRRRCHEERVPSNVIHWVYNYAMHPPWGLNPRPPD